MKLIDFGIAKASAAGMQTMSGTIKGKFGYMAPEYLAGKIDARADLFALGVIAHELLTDRPLFQGRDDMDTLYAREADDDRVTAEVEPGDSRRDRFDRDDGTRSRSRCALAASGRDARRADDRDQAARAWRCSINRSRVGREDRSATHSAMSRTPAPTRVLGTSPSISASSTSEDSVQIEQIEGESAGTASGHEDELLRTRLREGSHPPAQRTLLGSLPIAPQALRMPLPPPPLSTERTNLQLRTFVPEPEPVVAPPLAAVKPEHRRMGNLTILLLLLVAAAAAGAVVYFGLPYVQ